MNIKEDHPLYEYNTFHVKASCRWFAEVTNRDELLAVIRDERFRKAKKLILGGGSNILFTQNFDGLVIKNQFSGVENLGESNGLVRIRVGAGENWHQFVLSAVGKGLGGIENLSLIPGNTGASPMQNIGAYGVEVKDVIERVETIDMITGEVLSFHAAECRFGYRTSIFKTSLKDRVCISHVTFGLQKKPVLNTSYGAISQELEAMHVSAPTVADVSAAVIRIRQSKLPDPSVLGNAGSFFKNPVIPEDQAAALQSVYPEIPVYEAEHGWKKVPAGWLIEKAGWKGRRMNDHGVHTKQALVLVNYGQASGSSILEMADAISSDIRSRFGISLEKEVNIL